MGLHQSRRGHLHLFLLISIFLVVTLLAVVHLNAALWTDEMMTLLTTGASPHFGPISVQQSLLRLAADPWQAPLYFILIYLWGHVAGWSPFVLRAFSLYCGLLMLALLHKFVRRNFSPEIALYTVFVVGIGAFFINYLYDLRTYALVTLVIILLITAYERATRPGATWLNDLFLVMAVAAVLYTHYFAAIAVLTLAIFHLVRGDKHQRWWQITADFILGGLTFIPWSFVFVQGLLLSVSNPRMAFNMTPSEMIFNVLDMFSNGAQALMLLLGIVALSQRTRSAVFVWLWLLISLVIVIIVTRFLPSLYDIRYLIFLWPALGIIVGIGIAELRRRGIPPAVLLGIWLVACLWNVSSVTEQNRIVPVGYRPPFDTLRKSLDQLTLADDAVIYPLPELAPDDEMHPVMLNYYLSDLNLKRSVLIPDTEATTEALYAQNIHAADRGAARVWLTYEAARRNWRVGTVTQQLLPQDDFAYCGVASEQNDFMHVELWAHRALLPDIPRWNFPTPEGGQISLQPAQLTLTDSQNMFVAIQWSTQNFATPQYSFALHIFDSANQLVAQLDHGVEVSDFGCFAQVIDLHSLPPGQYSVRLGAYNWQTGVRLMPNDGQNDWPLAGQFDIAN